MAAQDYFGVVQQLYISYFGRPADPNGLQNFASQLDAMKAPTDFNALQAAVQADKAGTTALSRLVNTFNNSPESIALYGNDNSQIGVQKFVAAIYQNVLGREADLAGFNFWVSAITSGSLTKANAAAAITQAALVNNTDQGKLDALTVKNKLAVAESFTTALDTPTEIIAYSGDAAAAAARALLQGVNNTTSLTAYQANITATINTMVNVAVPGVTVTLTAGLDSQAGTAGNDTFNALSVKADGTAGSTINNFDVIDGGAGKDTLNIYTDANRMDGATPAPINTTLGANTTISNIETVNIYNANGAAAGLTDASKFAGVTALWQIGAAAAVTNLASTTTAGFRNTAAGTIAVGAADAAATATVALDGVGEGQTLNVTSGAAGKLATVTVSGTVTDTNADKTVTLTNLNITGGKDVQTLTVNSAVAVNLAVTNNGKAVTTINAAGSTGAITYADSETTVANITTGAAKDNVTIVTATVKDDTATTADETVNASVNTGAGDDTIDIKVSGTGVATVIAGEGNDTVTLTSRGTATLDIQLGAGNDTFTAVAGQAVGANDKVDAGAGTDTLLLNLVGSANVGAFSNFDAFDAAGLAKALDLDILTQKNTVTEVVASADVGTTAALTNVGAGVGFRATADIGVANTLTLSQKTAGAMTVTVDADETGTGDATIDTVGAKVAVTNATSINAVFGTDYLAAVTGEATVGDNVTTLQLSGGAATSVTVNSGGANSDNVLVYADTSTGTTGKLATITVTGAQALTLSNTFAATNSGLSTVDASAATGGLDFALAGLANGGKVVLGSGVDAITVTSTSTIGTTSSGVESIVGFEKTSANAVSADASATAKAAAIADADVLVLTGAIVADAVFAAAATSFTGGTLANGVVTFTGSGPSTLAAAAIIAGDAAETNGEAVVFEYLGNSYVFVQGGATDTLVQLTGVTGVKNFAETSTTGTGSDQFFIV